MASPVAQDDRTMVAREVLFDDITGESDAERIELTINGRSWVLDLAKTNRERFDRALEPFLTAAHPVGRHPKAKTDGPTPAAVRAWCTENNVSVSPKGKIPDEVMTAYLAGQSSSPA